VNNVYLAQVNNQFGLNVFLPYSVGLLQAYAQTIPEIKSNYDFRGFVYLREPIHNVINRLESPAVFGFSCYIWNWSYTLALAQAVKKAFPECLIVMGGPHVLNRSEGFFLKHSFADLLVHQEGEYAFADILLERLKSDPDYKSLVGLSIKQSDGSTLKTPPRPRITDLDKLPSPYLTGVFDELIKNDKYEFHASQETHRGCIAGGSKIVTPNGEKDIENVIEGDKILGWDENNKKIIWNIAEECICTGEKLVIEISAGDYNVRTTEDHPFYTERGWIAAGKIRKGDTVLCLAWREIVYWAKVDSITSCGITKVYDIVNAKPYPNFFSNGILVHNCPYQCTFCISEGTQIETMEGMKLIENIKPKDKVLGFDEYEKKLVWNTVEQLKCNGIKSIIKILIGEKYVESTGDHPFYTRSGWKDACELTTRDEILFVLQEDKITDYKLHWRKITAISSNGKKRVYDIINAKPTHNFFANGFLVSNCDWGSNTFAKVKLFGTDRLINEIYWFAQHKIDLLYNCDANYALFERDIELTKKMAEIKREYGFPNKFRAAYAKNSNDRVFQVAKILNDAGMNKGITLSFQSMDDNTLTIIKRKNIKIKDFKGLMQRYNSENIATYSEIIIGLPGETYNTFADGLNTLIECGQHTSISVYTCEILPNAEMNDPEYRKKYDIKTVKTPVLFYHGTPSEDPYQEYYELIVGTNTLSYPDWLKCQRLAWIIQCCHCLSLTQCLAIFLFHQSGISYRQFYEELLRFADRNPETVIGRVTSYVTKLFEGIMEGKEWGIIDERFGNIVWPVEEGGFLKIMAEKEQFYKETTTFIKGLIDSELIKDLIEYQKSILIDPYKNTEYIHLNWNIHEYLQAAYMNEIIPLVKESVTYSINGKDYNGDLETYAKEVIWFGRKGGTFKHKAKRAE
jgi:radical SAM superfamily enzyme YgiQ (UPF0313 family)